ncbi:MAG TPA: helix-turn-helix transcriptional regulator [Candidatus Omnitrophota bacterium]|nr:helix-turn-helix transcriptional regulator [Candidatus Omnitrophota bacterium]
MSSQTFDYSKYFWDLNDKALGETRRILKDTGHEKFTARMVKLLSRCQSPEEVFSVISKEDFAVLWPKLRAYWVKKEKLSDFRDWWETIYEELLRKQRKIKKPEGGSSGFLKGIGMRIKEARIDREMSQKDLALSAGMRQPDISKIEEGKKNITLETLSRICRCLGIKEISMEN